MTATDLFWLLLIFIALQPLLQQKTMEFARKRLLVKMEQGFSLLTENWNRYLTCGNIY